MSKDKNAPIAIIGGGAWGLSTALHLSLTGYSDITVFDRAETIPSHFSAAYDLNKIVRAEYEDEFYTQLALEAIEGWKTPLFGPYYHQTGYIVATSGEAPPKAVNSMEKALASVSKHPKFALDIHSLTTREDFRGHAWQFSGPLNGFRGYFNPLAGYAHSGNALKGVCLHLASRGVKFLLGETRGKVIELLAAISICALGAYGASLIPELGYFAVARCWSVAHVQLTEQECDLLRNLPVTNVRDLGFFFEPDPATRLFKLCPLGAGYSNTDASGTSLPPPDELPEPQGYIPLEDERKLRQLLRETLPWMADRPFVGKKMCWFSDIQDSEYCVDFVPGTGDSLVVLAGDSGHGFKMMPVFGKWVVDLLQDRKQKLARWRWRQHDGQGNNWADSVSWRVGNAREIGELIEEKNRITRAYL
ncbi:hypothetical protein H2201_009072 [Coniosporium apollinis]|uniref:FAD dependent oxidoreductase domain-containing protein n=1 Tax=Coniosporium apollinis TaxID=61459 RepID=A0ABQ9NI23_9PEZI|nr:hypothetical protein H2201_009072 [Coniosporium apollinis]